MLGKLHVATRRAAYPGVMPDAYPESAIDGIAGRLQDTDTSSRSSIPSPTSWPARSGSNRASGRGRGWHSAMGIARSRCRPRLATSTCRSRSCASRDVGSIRPSRRRS